MPSPFPGMDPYLEDPDLWPDVHAELITDIRQQLTPKLRPRYIARVEQYTFLFDPDDPASELYIVPDVRIVQRHGAGQTTRGRAPEASSVAVAEPIDITGLVIHSARHRFLEIRDAASRQVITIIEVVSPANKRAGAAGRRRFQEKREEVTGGDASWLEIDLLRAGTATVHIPHNVPRSPYLAYADRTAADGRRQWALPIQLRNPLPVIPVPLRPGEPDVSLDLQAVLDTAYERAGYDGSIDYTRPPAPPALDPDDAAWADALLKAKGLRN